VHKDSRGTDTQPMRRKGDVIVPTRYNDIEQNEVLWIDPELCRLPELPGGFALRVDDFLGRDYSSDQDARRVWVRGPVLLDARGTVLRILTLRVPVDQPRAALTNRAHAPDPPQPQRAEPTRAVGIAPIGKSSADRANEQDLIQHAGRQYRRVEIRGAPDASAPNGQPGGPHH